MQCERERCNVDTLLEYENLVYSIIHKFGYKNDAEDLYQVGMMGLVEAYQNFDDSLNVKFSTYAYYYVVGEITKYIRENKNIKVGKDVVHLYKSINEASEVLTQKLGRVPSRKELSNFLEVPEEKLSEVILLMQDTESLDYTYDDESRDLYHFIALNQNMDMWIDLKDELKRLSPFEKRLIHDRYFENMTQEEVSKKNGISQVQVSRKEAKILQKLKQRL